MMKIDRAFCVCFVTLVCASLAHANNDEWKNPVGGTVETDTNWLDGSTPGNGDQATFDKAGTYTVRFSGTPATIQDLFVSGGNVTLNNVFAWHTLNAQRQLCQRWPRCSCCRRRHVHVDWYYRNGAHSERWRYATCATGGTLNVFQGSAVTASNLIDNFGSNIVVDGKSGIRVRF